MTPSINATHQQSLETKFGFAVMNTTCKTITHLLRKLIHEQHKAKAAIKIQKAFRKFSLKLIIRRSEAIDQNEVPQTEMEQPIDETFNNREMFHEFGDASPLDQVACVDAGADPEIEASLLYAAALSSLTSPVINDVIKKLASGEAIPLP